MGQNLSERVAINSEKELQLPGQAVKLTDNFCAPLTVLQDTLEHVLGQKIGEKEKFENQIKMILHNCSTLLSTVDQIPGSAKFESGGMKLKISLQNIVPFLKTRIVCFESWAFKNRVELEFKNEEDKIFVYFDPQKIERIIFNLLFNAFNYTPPGGKISVSLQSVMESTYPSGCIKIGVYDAGVPVNNRNCNGVFPGLSREIVEFILRFPGEPGNIGAAAEKELTPGDITLAPVDMEFMKETQAIIEKNLTNPSFGVIQMAKLLYISRSSLFKKIKALTGQSAQLFIRSYRIQRAAQLLKAGAGNVTEVAFAVGFTSAAYFTKCFKEMFHQLPSDY